MKDVTYMELPNWLQMMAYQQELHHFSRELLSQKHTESLTVSERELLVLLYLNPEGITPLSLSQRSGMKKEAVSRCLKRLYEKECIKRAPHPQDDRSHLLTLTETGRLELKKDCRTILKPLYDLWRNMDDDFETLFELIREANRQIGSSSNPASNTQ